jgi:hypothetical protein
MSGKSITVLIIDVAFEVIRAVIKKGTILDSNGVKFGKKIMTYRRNTELPSSG